MWKSTPSAFKGPLLNSLDTMSTLTNRTEHVHDDLVRTLMQVSGLIPENGYKLTGNQDPRNKLVMEFNGKEICAILDWALWTNQLVVTKASTAMLIGKQLLLHATEIKLESKDFNYAQLVGQSLLHANFNFQNELFDQENGSVTAFSLALSGWNVRFMTLRCPYEYLESLSQGIVSTNNIPEIKLSRPYSLLKMNDRKQIIGSLKGRKLMLNLNKKITCF